VILGLIALLCGAWAAGEPAGRIALFDGESLDGWEGAPGWWSVENGALTAESTAEKPCKKANYLVWTASQPGDFVLEFEVKLSADANSGVQFRSERRPDHDMFGYQADMTGDGKLVGFIYHHRGGLVAGRGQQLVFTRDGQRQEIPQALPSADKLLQAFKPGEWNRFRIRCQGPELSVTVNGTPMCAVTDRDPKTSVERGFIGLQMHPGPPMKVQFRDLFLTPL
jgi:hypothetical protein